MPSHYDRNDTDLDPQKVEQTQVVTCTQGNWIGKANEADDANILLCPECGSKVKIL